MNVRTDNKAIPILGNALKKWLVNKPVIIMRLNRKVQSLFEIVIEVLFDELTMSKNYDLIAGKYN